MALFSKKTPLQKEWKKLKDQESRFYVSRTEKKDTPINQFLEEKVPGKLQQTLDKSFAKAFQVVFEKGTGVIEKTYRKEEMENQFHINNYVNMVEDSHKSLKKFTKDAKKSNLKNIVFSSTSGAGLGAVGVGLPDIVLFTGTLLKSIYEIAINYGYEYTSEKEKKFILDIVRGATSYGNEFKMIDEEINVQIDRGVMDCNVDLEDVIADAAKGLSGELLYMKFLQGIPVVGAVGGVFNGVYIRNITKYAEMKYRRRFYTDKMLREFDFSV